VLHVNTCRQTYGPNSKCVPNNLSISQNSYGGSCCARHNGIEQDIK